MKYSLLFIQKPQKNLALLALLKYQTMWHLQKKKKIMLDIF